MNTTEREQRYVFQTYKRFPLKIARGKGVFVEDEHGKQYLDFLTGIAVNALGHCHPAITDAACAQLRQLSHTSNLYYTEPMLNLAQKLVERSGMGKVFYANSGAEANEAAIKLARKFHPEKWEIICCQQSFHGRTLATITATGQPKYQKGFEPLVPGFHHVEFNNITALEAAISEQTAAIMIEPIQGEGGVIIPDKDYLKQVRQLCDRYNILMILDEIQTGCGRTGKFFCFEYSGILPDIVTLAKALGGGLPIGACLATDMVASAFNYGDHAATFGANPVCCAAGLAFIDVLEKENLLEKCRESGQYILQQFNAMLSDNPLVKEIRGLGLMIGIELNADIAPQIVMNCLKEGLLIGSAGEKVVRMLPPYIITKNHIDHACDILLRAFKRD
ncbi:acetylornithine transaminase [candidate division KSB1 bacterium]|nr:acetylornithine transaminase [candidate division KSB1 bacterium]